MPVPAPRAAAETDAGYLARLLVLDGTGLVGSSFALAQGGVGRLVAPLATATTTERLPAVGISTVGPPSIVAGTSDSYDLRMANLGSARANALGVSADASGAPLPVGRRAEHARRGRGRDGDDDLRRARAEPAGGRDGDRRGVLGRRGRQRLRAGPFGRDHAGPDARNPRRDALRHAGRRRRERRQRLARRHRALHAHRPERRRRAAPERGRDRHAGRELDARRRLRHRRGRDGRARQRCRRHDRPRHVGDDRRRSLAPGDLRRPGRGPDADERDEAAGPGRGRRRRHRRRADRRSGAARCRRPDAHVRRRAVSEPDGLPLRPAGDRPRRQRRRVRRGHAPLLARRELGRRPRRHRDRRDRPGARRHDARARVGDDDGGHRRRRERRLRRTSARSRRSASRRSASTSGSTTRSRPGSRRSPSGAACRRTSWPTWTPTIRTRSPSATRP